jgi:hypothetical protein
VTHLFIFFIFAVHFFMKQIAFIFLLVCTFSFSQAQKNISYDKEKGIDAIEQQYLDTWKKIMKMDGFRIQVTSFAGVNSKTLIEKTASQFEQQFPKTPCYKSYLEPNFRLRVGNYRTKLEAFKALQKISPIFPGAFVIKEQIDFKNP